jgi:hypothetical protein
MVVQATSTFLIFVLSNTARARNESRTLFDTQRFMVLLHLLLTFDLNEISL